MSRPLKAIARSAAAQSVHRQLDAYKLAGRVALSKDLGYDGSQRLNDEANEPELQPSSVERRQKSLWRSPSDA